MNIHTQQGPEVPCPKLEDRRTRLAPIYQVKLVRERLVKTPTVCSPAEVAPIACDYLKEADREHFIVILLSTNNQIVGINTVHIGSLQACIVAVREVFKPAILANAAPVIVAHNHASGNVEPSREDIAISKRLVEAGRLLEVEVVDSLIVGHDGKYTSLAERGLIA